MGDPIVIGILVGVEAFALAIGEANKTLLGPFFPNEACRQAEQVADLHRQHGARTRTLADFLADKTACLPVLGNPCARQHRHPHEEGEVTCQGEHGAQGQRGDRQPERVGVHPCQAGEKVERPAQTFRRHWQDQRVEPQESTGGQAGKHPTPVGLLPIEGAEHRRGQLGHSGKGDLADGRQAGGGAQQAVAHVRQQQDDHNAHPANRQHPVTEDFEWPLGAGSAQQPGQQHVVGNHGRQGDARYDDHASGRRCTANECQHGEGRMGLGHWQADHIGVRQHRAGQQHLAAQGDGHHKQCREDQISREHPLGQAQILGVDVLHHRHMKLSRQADDRHHGDAGLYHHRRPVDGLFPVFLKARGEHGLAEQIAETVVQAVGDKRTDGEKSEQLDQRLKGNRQHHAAVVFGGVEVACTEHDGKQRQYQRHNQGRVLGAGAGGVGAGADQQVHAQHDAFELQRDIGQHADQADQRHHHRQGLGFAVAGGDKVGD